MSECSWKLIFDGMSREIIIVVVAAALSQNGPRSYVSCGRSNVAILAQISRKQGDCGVAL